MYTVETAIPHPTKLPTSGHAPLHTRPAPHTHAPPPRSAFEAAATRSSAPTLTRPPGTAPRRRLTGLTLSRRARRASRPSSRGSCRWGCRRRRRSWRRRWWSRAITNTVDQERCFQYIPRARVFTGTCLNMESAYVTSLYPRETVAARTVQPWHSGRGSGSCDPLRLLHRRRSSVTS